MSYTDELDLWISEMESKVSSMKKAKQKRRGSRIKKKIATLLIFAEKVASEKGKLRIRRKLSSILSSTESTDLTLEDVEKAVDDIYGDQSQNATYYFTRKDRQASANVPHWSEITLEQAEKVMDRLYGDQSQNETFYPGRKTASDKNAYMTLEEVEKEMDDLYGDQSKNETFYPSRRSFMRQSSSEQPVEAGEGPNWYEMSLEDVEEKMDGLYGDQSKNETFYPGRRSASRKHKASQWKLFPENDYDISMGFLEPEVGMRVKGHKNLSSFPGEEGTITRVGRKTGGGGQMEWTVTVLWDSGKETTTDTGRLLYNPSRVASTPVQDRPLHEVEEEHDDFWGDQSKNETFYPSQRHSDNIEDVDWMDFDEETGEDPYIEAYDIKPDQYRLKDTDWEEGRQDPIAESLPSPWEGTIDPGYDPEVHDVEPSLHNRQFTEYKNIEAMQPSDEPGYFTPGEFETWDERVDLPAPVVDQKEDSFGDTSVSPAIHEAPHVIQERDRALGELRSLRGSLIRLGEEKPELRNHLRTVLDEIKR